MTSSPLCPPKLASFALVVASPDGKSAIQVRTTRALALPRPSVEFVNRPTSRRPRAVDSTLSLRAIDTQRERNLVYRIVYPVEPELPEMVEESSGSENDNGGSDDEEPPQALAAPVVKVSTWFKVFCAQLGHPHTPPKKTSFDAGCSVFKAADSAAQISLKAYTH